MENNFDGLKVMVIDDSKTIRRTAETLLQKALIKNNPDYANKPVIMLSSKDGLFDKARGRIVGSDEYLTKPFSKDELFEAINQYR